MNTPSTTIQKRIEAYRSSMRQSGLQAAIVPRTDPHLSEYISAHWHAVRWLTGFTGSAATLVITLDKACLWLDSRYFLQGEAQTGGTGIEIMKIGLPGTPTIEEYLTSTLRPGDTVGIDGMLMSAHDTESLAKALASKSIALDVDFAPLDKVWTDRPPLPDGPVFIHDVKYAGQSAGDKLKQLRSDIVSAGADAYFTAALDEIAWVLNLRCNDVPCNPVATSFLYVGQDKATLFIDPVKLTPAVNDYLALVGVDTAPYGDALEAMRNVPQQVKVLISPSRTSGAVAKALEGHTVMSPSPVAIPQAVKNPVQLQGIRQAHIRDGVYMVRSIKEIKETVEAETPLSEIGVAEILKRHRSGDSLFYDLSFESICGFGPNGAIVHYSATPESDTLLHKGNLLLIDSGANYLDATTDITRTIALGTPAGSMIHDFTLVMKGHIAIATAVYPEGTRGHQLDALARMPLWKEGKSYLHGTGHGVGHFLNVHEGPQSIRLNDTGIALEPGMLTSNEPGLYIEGQYGIRCENLVLTVEKEHTPWGRFLAFETVTMCPFDRTLLDTSMLTPDEIEWIDSYHRDVLSALSPMLTQDEREWLAAACAPLD